MNWFKLSQNTSYTAVVLDEESSNKLWDNFKDKIPSDWKKYCHHMTINMGKAKKPEDLGKTVELSVFEFGMDDMAAAVKVSGYDRADKGIAHVTVAVNTNNGGKPKHSNDIASWNNCNLVQLKGTIKEV